MHSYHRPRSENALFVGLRKPEPSHTRQSFVATAAAKHPTVPWPMHMLPITNSIAIPLREIELEATRSQGAGGQNVNKLATAIHLRFDIGASSLPTELKERLLQSGDHRITADGVVVIKAQQHRRQEQNREAALSRLQQLVRSVVVPPKPRRATKPSRRAKEKRLQAKKHHSQTKSLRRKVTRTE